MTIIKTGIYKIEHTESGNIYIGSAVNVPRRWIEHKYRLNSKTHPNIKLQRSWGKYGSEAFTFEVLLYCEVENLIMYEQRAINSYKASSDQGFNLCPAAGSILGIKRSDETKKKMSESQKGREFTEEHKRNISEGMAGKKRGPHSEESKKNISESLKGKTKGPQSEETKAKRSASLKGRKREPFSEETKLKMSLAQKGKTISDEQRKKISESMKIVRNKK